MEILAALLLISMVGLFVFAHKIPESFLDKGLRTFYTILVIAGVCALVVTCVRESGSDDGYTDSSDRQYRCC